MKPLTTDEKLDLILEKIENIERMLDPMASISAEEAGNEVAEAILSGDKARYKAAVRRMNGGRK